MRRRGFVVNEGVDSLSGGECHGATFGDGLPVTEVLNPWVTRPRCAVGVGYWGQLVELDVYCYHFGFSS